MIDNKIKNILLECLNENIKIEGMIMRYNLYEATGTGSTGGYRLPPNVYPHSSGNPNSYRVIPKAKPFIPDPQEEQAHGLIDKLVGMGEVGGVIAGLNKFTSLTTGMLDTLGISGAYGANWVVKNLANILPNQESLRKEGLGYTKGWAKMADL